MTDENDLWATVARNYKSMDEYAPEGYAARVEVYLHGSADPLPAVRVESRRDDPWVLFHVYGSMDDAAHPGDRLIFAHRATVARVEVGYVRKTDGRVIGFRVEDTPQS
jgi:hypothetical protein